MINSMYSDINNEQKISTAERRMVKYFRKRPDRAAEMLLNVELLAYQRVALLLAWYFPFTLFILTRGAGKTFMLALLAVLRAILYSNQRVGLIAASFRQSKLIFSEIERMYNKSYILRQMADKPPVRGTDMCYFNIRNGSEIQALPLGDGEKIRVSFYYLVLDELAQIPEEIINVVIIGMTATKQNPIRNAKLMSLQSRLKKEGRSIDSKTASIVSELTKNFIIGASTAYYQFNHLFEMLKNYVRIINDHVMGEGEMELWKLYSVYKLSYKMIPEGFMSIESINMAKEKMSSMQFNMEYNCLFPSESNGFFPAHVVVNAVTMEKKTHFEVVGQATSAYILFIDPARTSDNCTFAVAKVVSVTEGTRYACVYLAAVSDRKYQEAAAKVREICRRFNIVRIGMDKGGGGLAIKDLLNDPDKCPAGEELIWDYEDPASFLDKEMRFPKPGKQILHMVQFAPQWLSEANHGLLSSLERKEMVFPTPLGVDDLVNKSKQAAEELEAVEEEINSAKYEIINIVMTQTPKGLPHWDTPSPHQKKDRYSATLGLCQECKDFIKPDSANQDVNVELATGDWAGRNIGKEVDNKLLSADISDMHIAHRVAKEKRKSLGYSKAIADAASLN